MDTNTALILIVALVAIISLAMLLMRTKAGEFVLQVFGLRARLDTRQQSRMRIHVGDAGEVDGIRQNEPGAEMELKVDRLGRAANIHQGRSGDDGPDNTP